MKIFLLFVIFTFSFGNVFSQEVTYPQEITHLCGKWRLIRVIDPNSRVKHPKITFTYEIELDENGTWIDYTDKKISCKGRWVKPSKNKLKIYDIYPVVPDYSILYDMDLTIKKVSKDELIIKDYQIISEIHGEVCFFRKE